MTKIWLGILLLATLFGTGCAAAAPQPLGKAQPNILFVLADDMRADELGRVERLQWLTRRGVTFRNSFVTTSVCCPSRTTALTGQYSHNHGVLTNEPPRGGYEAYIAKGVENSTLPLWLQRAGYKTALFGKFLNGYDTEEPPNGFDIYHSGRRGAMDPELGTEAAKFVEANAAKPLFVALWVKSPHSPFKADERFARTHDAERFRSPPSFDERGVSDKAVWLRERPKLTAEEQVAIRADEETRLEMLEGVGSAVWQVASAMGENTYVVFTSDNGFLLGEHRIAYRKSLPYEESIHVPLVIAGPGIAHGERRKELVANNDLAPTMAEWAGVEASDVDGRSLVPLLEGGTHESWRDALLSEHPSLPWAPGHAVLITEDGEQRLRYIEWSTGERELYDLATDPYQLKNLITSTPKETLSQYAARLEALRTCAGDSCREAEDGTTAIDERDKGSTKSELGEPFVIENVDGVEELFMVGVLPDTIPKQKVLADTGGTMSTPPLARIIHEGS